MPGIARRPRVDGGALRALGDVRGGGELPRRGGSRGGASRLDRVSRGKWTLGLPDGSGGPQGPALAHSGSSRDSPTLGAVAIDGEVLVGDETLGALKRLDRAEERGGDPSGSSRSRSLVKVVGVQTLSSSAKPTNQRKEGPPVARPGIHSVRTECNDESSGARKSCSGGIDSRPAVA